MAEAGEYAPAEEEWRPVVGYEGLYEVSSIGRVRSVDRTVVDTKGVAKKFRGIPLAPTLSAGYETVALYRQGQRKTWWVHRVVAMTFIGPKPEGNHVRHLNGVRLDNRVENLAYGTPKQNLDDAVRHGRPVYGWQKAKTKCPRGHPYDNVRRGYRECTKCRNAQQRERYHRKVAAAKAVGLDSARS